MSSAFPKMPACWCQIFLKVSRRELKLVVGFSSLSLRWPLFPPPVQAFSHLKRCGFYLCHQFVGTQEVHIFVDTIHSQLGYKNSDVIPRKAACFMMLSSVPIALLKKGNEGQLGGRIVLQCFLVGTSASGWCHMVGCRKSLLHARQCHW